MADDLAVSMVGGTRSTEDDSMMSRSREPLHKSLIHGLLE
jgi:hypothetical protein